MFRNILLFSFLYSNFIVSNIFLMYGIFENTHPYEGESDKTYTYKKLNFSFYALHKHDIVFVEFFFLPPVIIFVASCFRKANDNRPGGSLLTVVLLTPDVDG